MNSKTRIFTKTIWVLSFVSLFTDISSEMLYPVMPMFLTSIGFSVLWIGILEGIAEATTGFSKGYFGRLSDVTGKKAIFVRWGYFLSSVSKPMMALIAHPFWVLFSRTTDRFGKGIRTSARDSILSSETTREHKGKVFGLHRAADTIGAAIGPILALILLNIYPAQYKLIFFIAFIPAIIGVSFTFIVKDKQPIVPKPSPDKGFFSFLSYWKISNSEYKRLVTGLLIFALINSSDLFLLLMAKHRGLPDNIIITVYIFFNLIYAVSSTPLGYLGDKIGFKRTFIIGLLFFVSVYFGIAFIQTQFQFFIIFLLYGIYNAGTEGISKAWISNLAKNEDTATAIGFYNSWQSIMTLLSSVIAGILWKFVSPETPFIFSSIITIFIIFYLMMSIKTKKPIGIGNRV